MSAEIRTIVTFSSSRFNTSESKEYFINEGCFGDDVAKWIVEELRREGYTTAELPGQEDFGWYLVFQVCAVEHCLVVGYRPGESIGKGTWIGWLERSRSFLSSLLGGRGRGIATEAVVAIHKVLSNDPTIQDIRWHFKGDFDAGREELGVPKPIQLAINRHFTH